MAGASFRTSSVEIVDGLDNPAQVMRKIEHFGRVAHRSWAGEKGDSSARDFVRMIVKLGHESVLEHHNISVMVITDRATAQQWLRHRLASYTMESQRYVNYAKRGGLEFIRPVAARNWSPEAQCAWEDAMRSAGRAYGALIAAGLPAEDARSVLPNATATTFVTTANLRQWRHFFAVRDDQAAQSEIRALANALHKQLSALLPDVFPAGN